MNPRLNCTEESKVSIRISVQEKSKKLFRH